MVKSSIAARVCRLALATLVLLACVGVRVDAAESILQRMAREYTQTYSDTPGLLPRDRHGTVGPMIPFDEICAAHRANETAIAAWCTRAIAYCKYPACI
jgi:hypothetical protein